MSYRVRELIYRVVQEDDNHRVISTAELHDQALPGFVCRIVSSQLMVEPTQDFPDETAARAALDPFLRAWEATSELIDGYALHFRFVRSQLEYTGSPEPGGVVSVSGIAITVSSASGTLTVNRGTYPTPLPDIQVEGAVTQQLRPRLRAIREGRETVTAGAYYIFTKATKQYGGPKLAAEALNLSSKLLSEVSRLANVGDPVHARKAGLQPGVLTPEDLRWLTNACAAIVRRVMEQEAGADISQQITKADLLAG